MKIRNGFVSNSSSTSFTFIIREDDTKELFDKILKYHQFFELDYPYDEQEFDTLTAQEVIDSIKETGKSLITLDEVIKQEEKDWREYAKYCSDSHYYDEEYQEHFEKIQFYEKAKGWGFTHVMIINFGDNHGDIAGGKVGYIMDYSGRYIYINQKDFKVKTEQNR